MSVGQLNTAILSAWTKCLPPPYGDGSYSAANDRETKCNLFTHDVCAQMHYIKFAGMTANQMFDAMEMNDDWLEVAGDVAQFHANNGALVIAAWKNPTGDHGHVCVVIPGVAETSGSWGVSTESVPKVANVSEPNLCRADRKASFAFSVDRIPKYFVKKDMIP